MRAFDPSVRLGLLILATTLVASPRASAQEAPVTTPLSTNTLSDDGQDADDETAFSASLGGSLNTGNTESWQLNAGTELRIVRMPHAFGHTLSLAYGKADIPDDTDNEFKDTVKNFSTKARYEYYLTRMDALFLAAAFRWDEFAGLDARVQGQAGYLRNFVKTDDQRFWGEAGYDITYDNYHPDPLIDEDTGDVLPGDDVIHSARLFFGYDGHINSAVSYLTGLEGLMNVEEPKDTRINWDNALRSALGGNFQVELKFSLQYDNLPVPGTRKVDTQTLVSLLYNFVDAPEPPPEAPTGPCPGAEAEAAPEPARTTEAAPEAEPAPAPEAEPAPATEATPTPAPEAAPEADGTTAPAPAMEPAAPTTTPAPPPATPVTP